MYNKVCTVCGKHFVATQKRTSLCSDECRKIAQRASLDKYLSQKVSESRARVAARTCEICGKSIDPKTKKVKYCSDECAKIGFKIKHREGNAKKEELLKATKLKEKLTSRSRKITLDKTLRAMNKYNAKHGTHLDYGQYARLLGL